MNQGEEQMQIDDRTYGKIMQYLLEKGITLNQFADILNISYYMLGKAMDRNIRMSVYVSLVSKILGVINCEKSEL